MKKNYINKIVATIGPVSANKESIKKLYKAGMSVARLNGSHSNLEWHAKTISLIKSTIPTLPILLDIPGKKIRTVQLEFEPEFDVGDIIILTTLPGFLGKEKISINNLYLHESLSKGDIILADDGTLRFEVNKIIENDIYCLAKTKGKLKSAKGINVPHIKIKSDLINQRDIDMMKFAVENEVDFVGISFVESSEHIKSIRALSKNSWPRIVAKVENQGGLDNLDEIAKETDVIMIDRGDLSTETNMESVAIYQKRIIRVATKYAKPVIVATEMLHTMISNPFPTKAEVTDITNAILDGASATMLSGETAIGDYPIESVEIMTKISNTVNEDKYKDFNLNKHINDNQDVPRVMGESIRNLCNTLPITKVVAITISGFAARMVSSTMLAQPIIAVSNDIFAAKSFNLLRNTKGIYINVDFAKDNSDHVLKSLKYLYNNKEINEKDVILITSVEYPKSGRRMNMIQTHYVQDLIELFKW